jgi:plasmid stabilization system protein ParE
MSYDFRILVRAQREIREAVDWYEEKQLGLGKKFQEKVIGKIRTVSNAPLHYPLKGRIREAIVNDYPFLLLYRIDESNRRIVIMSVFHMSKHPNKK